MSGIYSQDASGLTLALDKVCAIATASCPLTTLSTGSRRLLAALAANSAANTAIRDENGDLCAVTFSAANQPPILTEVGRQRVELEYCNSPGK